MKKMKKLAALFLAVVMVMAMGMTAMAADGASITIKNAAKGENNYKVYKIFDAERNPGNGHMAYKLMKGKDLTGLPSGFEADSNGYITKAPSTLAKEDVDKLIAYVGLTWDETAKEYTGGTPVKTLSGNGGTLTANLDEYGYYLVVSDKGAVVSLNDTDPNAEIIDKNNSKPVVDPEKGKTVDDADVHIGEDIEYTLTFDTVNYVTEGYDQGTALDDVEEPKQVKEYIITDTLPESVTFKEFTSITVDGEDVFETLPAGFTDGKLTISWLDNDGNSKYANNAELVVKYKVTVNEKIALGAAAENKNEVALSWKYTDNTEEGGDGYKSDVTISTYAMVLQKVDGEGHNLAGAKFTIKGYSVTGSAGEYKITGKLADEDGQSIEMDCDANGKLVIYGLAKTEDGKTTNEKYTITESTAPVGYNILAEPKEVEAEKVATTVTTTSYDKDGNVTDVASETVYTKTEGDNITLKIENLSGVTLPSTGGIGTTIFYVVGGILVLGAAVLLITKKRMSARN